MLETWGFCEDIKHVKDIKDIEEIKDIKDIMNIVDDNSNNNSDTTGESSFLPPAPRVSPPVPPYGGVLLKPRLLHAVTSEETPRQPSLSQQS